MIVLKSEACFTTPGMKARYSERLIPRTNNATFSAVDPRFEALAVSIYNTKQLQKRAKSRGSWESRALQRADR